MRHGRELLYKAEDMLYHSSMNRSDRADLLTSMAILSGLTSADLPLEIIRRRRDIMGGHQQFKHSEKSGKVTVPHPKKDLPVGTLRNIYRQAGWQWR
jgi:predicted RNA binding protein YcfA (HicA-like mRNA interferase family)